MCFLISATCCNASSSHFSFLSDRRSILENSGLNTAFEMTPNPAPTSKRAISLTIFVMLSSQTCALVTRQHKLRLLAHGEVGRRPGWRQQHAHHSRKRPDPSASTPLD